MKFDWKRLFARQSSAAEDKSDFDAFDLKIDNDVTVVKFLRKPTMSETESIIRHLADQNIYHRRIWDATDIEFPYSMDELREMAALAQTLHSEKNRMAVVIRDSVGFGSIRAFLVHREGDNRSVGHVFKEIDEAMAWVLAED